MRELKRSIARHLMEMHEVTNINKKKFNRPSKDPEKNDTRKVSFFALHWREYLDPKSKYRKSLEGSLRRSAALQSRKYNKRVIAPWPVTK